MKTKPNSFSMLHKVFILKLWPPYFEPMSLENTIKRSYCAKFLITTIEDFIGVFVWNYCKSTTTIKMVAVELVLLWDLWKGVNHMLESVKGEVSTRTSLIGY